MAYGELRRSKKKILAAAIRDAHRNFTAAVSGRGSGASARKVRVTVEVRRAHGTAASLTRRGVGYVAKACLRNTGCKYAKGATPTKAVKMVLAALSGAISTR